MKKTLSMVLSCLSLAACATKTPGREARAKEGNPLPIKVHAEQVAEYSDEYNAVISMTFHNAGERWLHIEEIGLEFPEGPQQNVIVGDDLKAWAESYRIRKQVENFNDSLGVAAAILGGVLIAATNPKNANAAAAGTAVATGARALDQTSRIFRTSKRLAEIAPMVPEGHIYRAFSIPPKGYARRWFLLNTPQKLIVRTFAMNVRSVELGDGAFDVPIRE